MQHVYDAIKKARETGEAWVTFGHERLRIVPLVWNDQAVDYFADGKSIGYCPYFEALVKTRKRGGPKIRIEHLNSYKDVGGRVKSHFTGRFLGWDSICAVIAERHPRDSAPA